MMTVSTLAAIGIIGAAAIGLEAIAVSRVSQSAKAWLASGEMAAIGHAGRIAAETMGRSVAGSARDAAFAAALEAVRGIGWIYGAVQGPADSTHVRVHPGCERRCSARTGVRVAVFTS